MKIAMLFPGQGAQAVGMGRELHRRYPEVRAVFDEASELSGMDLATLCFSGPRASLTATEKAQPAVFTLSLAIHRLLGVHGITPAWVAGHSLGELSAMTAAGALSLEQGLQLVMARGRLMAEALRDAHSGMAALEGPDPAQIEAWLKALDQPLWIANYNAPAQTAVSGTLAAIDRLEEVTKAAGVRMTRMTVAGAFHSPLLDSAGNLFAEKVAEAGITDPICPVVGNVTGTALCDATAIRTELQVQMGAAVRWTSVMENLLREGIDLFIEVGPGKILKGLLLRTDRNARCAITDTPRDIDLLLQQLGAVPA